MVHPESRTGPGGGVAAADPEQHPGASYAIDPALARRLTGRLVATSGRTQTTYAPFTGQPLAALPMSSAADVETATRRARGAQRTWAAVPLQARADMLLNLHDLVLARQDEILDLVQWECGKSRLHAFEEVMHVALTARYYGRRAQAFLESERGLGVFPLLTRVDVHRVPKGVVGIISPWNYPFTMGLSDGLPALLAGNAVVHKPDSQTPLTAMFGVELLREAGMPADCWQLVYGPGSIVGTAIVEKADYVCFTGSTATGRQVATKAAERLIGCSLELGGKNPMLVLRDANLARAAEGAVRACFSSAGQLCVATERIYVADEIYGAFLGRFLSRVRALRLTADLSYGGDVGSLVSPAQLETVQRHVEDAKSLGATVLAGGCHRPDVGPLFYEPTVLTDVRPGMLCFGDETFGPVVSIYRFGDESEAVALANDGEYGLNASIWTRDTCRGRALAGQITAGTVNVNEAYAASFGSVDAPMGGLRSSGLGRRQGSEGIHRYTETQAVATERLLPIGPVAGMSERAYAATMTATLRLLKVLRRP